MAGVLLGFRVGFFNEPPECLEGLGLVFLPWLFLRSLSLRKLLAGFLGGPF